MRTVNNNVEQECNSSKNCIQVAKSKFYDTGNTVPIKLNPKYQPCVVYRSGSVDSPMTYTPRPGSDDVINGLAVGLSTYGDQAPSTQIISITNLRSPLSGFYDKSNNHVSIRPGGVIVSASVINEIEKWAPTRTLQKSYFDSLPKNNRKWPQDMHSLSNTKYNGKNILDEFGYTLLIKDAQVGSIGK